MRTMLTVSRKRLEFHGEMPSEDEKCENKPNLRSGISLSESKICPQCGKEFFQPPEDPEGRRFRKRIYCCKECSDKHNYPKKGKVKKICEVCGKEYMAYDFITSTGCYRKYCSLECQFEAARRRRQKEREFTVST